MARCALALAVAAAGLVPATRALADAQYSYDPAGRLTQAGAPSGAAVQYQYDAAGNISALQVVPASTLSVAGFSPPFGAPGATVVISGTGFSLASTVSFGGVAVSPSAATATSLTVAVPANAVTGKISVGNGATTVVSAASFTVNGAAPNAAIPFSLHLGNAQASTVTFAGIAGQSYVLSVDGLTTLPANTPLTAKVAMAGGAVLTTCTVPPGTCALPTLLTSGNYVVTFSSAAASAAFTGRLLLMGNPSGTLSVNAAPLAVGLASSQVGHYQFTGGASQIVGLSVNALLTGPAASHLNIAVTKADGTPVATTLAYEGTAVFVLPPLPGAGTYLVNVDPGSAAATFALQLRTVTPAAMTAGTPVTYSSGVPGTFGEYTFTTASPQNVTLAMTGSSFVNGESVTLYRTDSSVLAHAVVDNGEISLPALPAGTYLVAIAPRNGATGSVTLSLDADAAPVALTPDAAATSAHLLAGQNGRFTFLGTAGNVYGILLSSMVTAPVGTALTVTVTNPGGTPIASFVTSGAGSEQALLPLATSGTYGIQVNPGAATASFTIRALNAVTGTLVLNTAVPVTLANVGEPAKYIFSGNAGDALGLDVVSTLAPAGGLVRIQVLNPDGSVLAAYSPTSATSGIALPYLPTTSSGYVVVVDAGATSGSVSVKLMPDVTGTLAISTTSSPTNLTFTAATAGQGASYGLTLAATRNLVVVASGSTFAQGVDVSVYASSGTLVGSATTDSSGGVQLSLTGLAAGSYKVLLRPMAGATGSVSLGIVGDQTGALVVDAEATPPINLLSGLTARYTFTGAAGQALGLAVTGITTVPAGVSLGVTVLNPDASKLTSFSTSGSATGLTLPFLPAAGTYTVVVTAGLNTASFNLQLVSDLASAALSIAGVPSTFTNTKLGQGGVYTFSLSAVNSLILSIGSVSAPNGIGVSVYHANGSLVATTDVAYGANGVLEFDGLAADIYRVLVAPKTGALGSATLTLSADAAGTLVLGGSTASVSLAAKQIARYALNVTSAVSSGLTFTAMSTTPVGGSLNVVVLNPDSSQLAKSAVSGTTAGYVLPPLNVLGTYVVLVDPGVNTANFGMQWVADKTGVLTNGGAVTFTSAQPGQSGSYSFAATQGQDVVLNVSNVTFGAGAAYTVYRPSGAVLTSFTAPFGGSASPSLQSLPESGNYGVRITSLDGSSGSATTKLIGDAGSTLTVGAAATSASLSAGQLAKYTFTTSASSQALSVVFPTLSATAASPIRVTVGVAGQDFVFSDWVSGQPAGFALPLLPPNVTYTITVDPGQTAQTFGIQLVADISGNLTAGTAVTFNSTQAGLGGAYAFTATAGENATIRLSASTLPGSSTVTVVDSMGGVVGTTMINGSDAEIEISNLAAAPYRAVVRPVTGSVGKIAITLLPNVLGTLVLDTPTAPITLPSGQVARYSYVATAGQALGFGLTSIATTPPGSSVQVTVLRPDNSTLVSFSTSGAIDGRALGVMPMSGTYTFVLDPQLAALSGAVVQLVSDATGVLSLTAPNAVQITKAGQGGYYSFSATAAASYSLTLSADTVAGSTAVTVTDGSGSFLTNGSASAGSPLQLDLGTTATAGTYHVLIAPSNGATGTAALSVAAAAAAINGTLTLDAASTPVSLTASQHAYYTFTAVANQSYTVNFNALVTTPGGGTADIAISGPGGPVWHSTVTGDVSIPLTLLSAGTYKVSVGTGVSPSTFKLQALNFATGTLTSDGTPGTFTASRFGQSAVYTFADTLGNSLDVAAGTFTVPVTVTPLFGNVGGPPVILTPGAPAQLSLVGANSTRASAVLLIPSAGGTGSATMMVRKTLTQAVVTNAAPAPVSLASGQVGVFTLSADAAGLGLAAIATQPANAGLDILVTALPGGATLDFSTTALYGGPTAGGSLASLGWTGVPTGYSVSVSPRGAAATFTIQASTTATGSLTLDLPPAAVGLRLGQPGLYTFNGVAGQALGLGVVGMSQIPGGKPLVFTVYTPGSIPTALTSFAVSGASGGGVLPVLKQSGAYTVAIDPLASAANFGMQLLSDVPGTLVVNGSPVTFNAVRVGQAGYYGFTGATNQLLQLYLSGVTFPHGLGMTVYAPDGSVFASYGMGQATSGQSFVLPPLQQSGNYEILLAPQFGEEGSATLNLSTPATGALTPNAAPTTIHLMPSQQARFTYSGGGNQAQAVALTNVVTTPPGMPLTVTVFAPTGDVLTSFVVSGASSTQLLPLRPGVGTYTVVVDPGTSTGASFALQLKSVPTSTLNSGADATYAATSDGSGVVYAFAVSALDTLPQTLAISSNTLTTSLSVRVQAPDGSSVLSTSINPPNSGNVQLWSPSVVGVYHILVSNAPGAGTAVLTQSSPLHATLATSTHLSLAKGQQAAVTFTPTAGQFLGLAASGVSGSPSTAVLNPTLTDPTGAGVTLSNFPLATSFVNVVQDAVPAKSGTYRLVIPDYSSGGPALSSSAFTLALVSPVTGTLTADAAAQTVSLAGGQRGRFTFAGTQGVAMSLDVESIVATPSLQTPAFYVMWPDGTYLSNSSESSGANSFNYSTMPLPSTGQYVVIVDPRQASSVSMKMRLLSDAHAALPADGTPATFTATNPGQSAQYTFSATANQSLTLVLSANTFQTLSRRIFNPDGSEMFSYSAGAFAGSLILHPQFSGTFTLMLTPGSGQTGTVKVSVVAPLASRSLDDGTVKATTLVAGQSAPFTVTGVVAQMPMLVFSAVSTTPAGGTLTVQGNSPNAPDTFDGQVTGASGTIAMPLVMNPGTYTIAATSQDRASTFNVQLVPSVDLPITVGGSAVTYSTSTANRNAVFPFTGTGHDLDLLVTGTTFPAGAGITVFDSAGGLVLSDEVSPNVTASLSLKGIGTSTYYVALTPYASAVGSATLQLVPSGAAPVLIPDAAPLAGSFTLIDSASYTFAGTAGQGLGLALSFIAKSSPNASVDVTVSRQGGGIVAEAEIAAVNGVLQIPLLPASDTYKVVLSGIYSTAADFTIKLVSDVVKPATTTATSSNLAAGQSAQYTFTGSIGQALGFDVSGLALTPNTVALAADIFNPDGTKLWHLDGMTAGGGVALPALSQAGTYRIRLGTSSDTNTAATAAFGLALVPDQTGTLVTDGAATTFTVSPAGKGGDFTFHANTGDALTLIDSLSTLTAGPLNYFLYAPDGTALTPTTQYGSSSLPLNSFVYLNSFSGVGSYRLIVAPAAGATGTVALQLSSTQQTDTLVVGAAAKTYNVAVGQYVQLSFAATASQSLTLLVGGTDPTKSMNVFDPNGTFVTTVTEGQGSALINPAMSGNYKIVVYGSNTPSTLSMQLKASSQSVLTTDGMPLLMTGGSAGQLQVATFTAAQGQSYTLAVNASAMQNNGWDKLNVTITAPDNTIVGTTVVDDAGAALGYIGLKNTQAGIYTVTALPSSEIVLNATLNLMVPSSLTADVGLPVTLGTGQMAAMNFACPELADATMNFSAVSFNSAAQVLMVHLINVRGVEINAPVGVGAPGDNVSLSTLGGGTCAMLTTPSTTGATFTATLSSAFNGGTLVADTAPSTFTATSPGQLGLYKFAATAGQNFSVGLIDSTFPTGAMVWIWAPDGSYGGTVTVSPSVPSASIVVSNAIAGNYTLSVQSMGLGTIPVFGSGQEGSAKMFVVTPHALPAEVAPVAIHLAAGVPSVYTVAQAAGQMLDVALTGIATSPPGGSITVSATDSYGQADAEVQYTIAKTPISSAGYGVPFSASNSATVQSILFSPGAVAASLSARVMAPTVESAPLVINAAPLTFVPADAGRGGSYTFAVVANTIYNLYASNVTFSGGMLQVVCGNTAIASVPIDQPIVFLAQSYYGSSCTVTVTPGDAGTGSAALSLNSPVNGGTLGENPATPTTATLAAGQAKIYSISASDAVKLGVSSIATTPAGKSVVFANTVAGSQYATSTSVAEPGGQFNWLYNQLVVSAGGYAATVAIQLESAIQGGQLVPDASSPTSVTFSKLGQEATLSAVGVLGASYVLDITGNTLAGQIHVMVIDWSSSGTLASYSFSGPTSSVVLDPRTFGGDGSAIQVTVEPVTGITGSMSFKLRTR